ncbi:unnamed protein product, partial [marine sediment metagenome]
MTHKAYIDATNYPDVRVGIPMRIKPMKFEGLSPNSIMMGTEE